MEAKGQLFAASTSLLDGRRHKLGSRGQSQGADPAASWPERNAGKLASHSTDQISAAA